MKIAMIDPSLFTGRYDDSLCGALAGLGGEVALYGRPMRATDAIEATGYRYEPRFFRRSEAVRDSIGEGAAFRALKAGEYFATAWLGGLDDMAHADVVHVQWLPLPVADRRMLARIAAGANRPALVHTVHNASAFHGDNGAQGRGYRAMLDMFDALIAHGAETRESLIAQGVAAEKIHIVPHPPMELARTSEADLAAVKKPEKVRLLFFGTIRPYKGFDILIDVGMNLWREGLDFEIAVAGKPFMDVGPLLDSIRAAGFEDRLVLDLGFLTEGRLDAHLQRADIIVFPYRDIDSSGAFLSALHYGKAMVASRVGMFAGLDEEKVRLCVADDRQALADALRPVIVDAGLRARLGAGALALREEMGQWSDAAAATMAIYAQTKEVARHGEGARI